MTSQTTAVILAAGVLVLLLAGRVWRMFNPRPSLLDSPVIFFALVCGLMLVLRWPEITWPHGINLDEAQMLAQGMRFCAHPVPWQDVDGTTSGPLNSMFLSLPMCLGAPASWQTARMVLWAANCLTLVFLYLALRNFGTRWEAQFALAPAILFYSFALGPDFEHYSSETLPVLLISGGLCLLAREWRAVRPSKARLFVLGLIAGSLPFTKLQSSPLGVFLFAVALMQIFFRHRREQAAEKTGKTETGMLCLGAAVPAVLILGWVAARGAISDFWISYILASGSYAQEAFVAERGRNFWNLFAAPSDFRPYLLCCMMALAILLAVFFGRKDRQASRLRGPLSVMLAQGVLTVFCLLIAGKAFLHYTLLLVPVLALLTGLAFFAGRQGAAAGSEGEPNPATHAGRWFLIAFMLVFIPQAFRPLRYVRDFADVYPRDQSAEDSAVADRIRAASRPGDTLGIWGWMPSYYVETGLMPATRDVIGHYVITEGPHREFFRKRYLADLEQSRPAVFVDAVSDGAYLWWNWKRADAHEGFPELAAFINENYSLWWTVHLTTDGVPLRIYMLKSRLAELHLSAGNVAAFPVPNPVGQSR